VLVTIDTLRADYVGAYGNRADTPNLDRLAADGVVFERCVAQTPLTLPSHTTILSGTYPLHHGVRNNGGAVVSEDLELVSEVLQRKGYATGAFVAAYVLDSKWGLDQGFDLYQDDLDWMRGETLLLQNSRRADEVVALAEEWLTSQKHRRLFAWIHIFDPHATYRPPQPFNRYPEDPYRGEVEYTDHVLGGFFDFLEAEGIAERSVVIVASDHGEALGSHGEREHGYFLYEPVISVPLIVRPPFEPAVRRWGGLVELTDVAPTILAALDQPAPEATQGTSLWGIVTGQSAGRVSDVAYTETFMPRQYGFSELRALYQSRFKYIKAPREELYDLEADPHEERNLAGEPAFAKRAASMNEMLQELVGRFSTTTAAATPANLSPRDVAALRALGYVTGSTDKSGEAVLPDPKDKLGVYNRMVDCGRLLAEERFEEVVEVAEAIAREEPQIVEVHAALGAAYRKLGDERRALASYEKVLELNPDANFAMIDVLSVLLRLGENQRAVERGREFVARFPADPILHTELGYAYFNLGENERALEHLERAISMDPKASALTKAAELHGLRGDYATAERYIRRALEIDPEQPGAFLLLGQIEESRSNPEAALANYRVELEHNPADFRAAFRAAVILRSMGRMEEAVPYARMAIEGNPRFSLPYFMVAEYLLKEGGDLEEIIDLCRRGLEVAPEDRSKLAGYEILLELLKRKGDREGYERAAQQADALRRKLGSER
jgi:arylsulfatase A-like enzyme/Tfp pilus assembly protein PilF